MYHVSVDAEKCEGCEECINVCPVSVFQLTDGKADPYQASDCEFCESCISVCPTSAITITEM